MSTFPLSAREIATVVSYLDDPSVAFTLAALLTCNRAACADDGWSEQDMGDKVTAEDIRDAALDRPEKATRMQAASALSTLEYNCYSGRRGFLDASQEKDHEDLYLRVMEGYTRGDALAWRDAGPYRGEAEWMDRMLRHVAIAAKIRASRATAG